MVIYDDDLRAAPEMCLEVVYFKAFLSDLFYSNTFLNKKNYGKTI